MHSALNPDAGTPQFRAPGLLAAFAAVYIVWGSTYLAIRYAVETIPPFLMAATRFLVSGAFAVRVGAGSRSAEAHARAVAATRRSPAYSCCASATRRRLGEHECHPGWPRCWWRSSRSGSSLSTGATGRSPAIGIGDARRSLSASSAWSCSSAGDARRSRRGRRHRGDRSGRRVAGLAAGSVFNRLSARPNQRHCRPASRCSRQRGSDPRPASCEAR